MRVVLLLLLILSVKVQAADPHSFSNFALVSHPQLTLDLTADFDKQQLSGFVELQLDWHHPDVRELVLDSRDLSIEKVMGQSAEGRWLCGDGAREGVHLAQVDTCSGQRRWSWPICQPHSHGRCGARHWPALR